MERAARSATIVSVQNDELHFKQLDIATAHEDFLEKEMLDSDVHHLEVRGSFFDKLSILAAGSLAVGISFLIAGIEHSEVLAGIRQHIGSVTASFVLLFISLALSIIHNFLISRAVELLSFQLQSLYQAANLVKVWIRDHPNAGVSSFRNHGQEGEDEERKANQHDIDAKAHGARRDTIIGIAQWVGLVAVCTLLVGYAVGLVAVLTIYICGA